MDIQRSSGLNQYALADSCGSATAGRDAAAARESAPELDSSAAAAVAPEQDSAPVAETPSSAQSALSGVYARNARAVAVRMATPSVSLLA